MDPCISISREEEQKLYFRKDEDEACKNMYYCKTVIEKYELRLKVSANKPMIVAKENILPRPFHGVKHPRFPDPLLTVSFKEFTELAKAYAYVLKKKYNIQPQTRVAIMANTTPMNQLLVVALWYLRAIVIEISPKIGVEIKQCWMKMLDIKMCFYDCNFQPFYNDHKKLNEDKWIWNWIHPLNEDEQDLCSGKDGIQLVCMDSDSLINEISDAKEKKLFYVAKGDNAKDIITILGTSSSTQAVIKNGQCSTMKFVPVHASSLGCKYNNFLRKNVPLESVYYQVAPFHHSLGFLEGLFHPQESGGPLVFRTQKSNDIGLIPEMILDDLVEADVEEVTLFPYLYTKFKELQEQNHPRWPIWEKMFKTRPKGCFKLGGAAPNPEANKWLLKEFNIYVCENFGSTETGITFYCDGDPPLRGEEGYMTKMPWLNLYLKPLNDSDKNIGEAFINSYMCFGGYMKRLEKGEVSESSPIPGFRTDYKTDECFITIDGKKFYKTNDIFRRSPVTGRYKYVSRVDDIIAFSTGLKLNPLPFERTIKATCKDINVCSIILDTTKTEVVCFVEPEWKNIKNENGEYIDTSITASQLNNKEIEKLSELAQKQVWNSIHEVLNRESESLADWAKKLSINNVYIINYGEKFPMTDKGQASKRIARTKYSEVLNNITKVIQGELDVKYINNEGNQQDNKEENDNNSSIENNVEKSDNNDIKYLLLIIYESLKEHQLSLMEFKDFDPEKSFKYYGIDSLAIIKFTKTLSRKLKKSYSPTILFNYGTPLRLAKYLHDESFSRKEEIKETIPKSFNSNNSNKIAIIGMGLRLPGSINNENALWSALMRGKDCVLPLPKDRNLHIGYVNKPTNELRKGEHNIPRCGYYDTRSNVAKPTQFDASFFNCSNAEATGLDVKHRWILETSWEALESAGIAPSSLENSSTTGVFIGVGDEQETSKICEKSEYDSAIGSHNSNPSSISGRLSYFYKLYGPSITMDTACSTGATALYTACRSMMFGDCDLSIVSAASFMYFSDRLEKTCKAGMTSPRGRCATFDAEADGFATSEGCVTYILKRLEDAERDNDNILGVILGISSGQSGVRQSISAPSAEGQVINIKKALRMANVDPSQVSYVEAHGTGTPLGDALEVHGLNQVYEGSHTKENPLIVGSVKSNIGHTNEVAGLTGIAKVLISMKHKIIPRNIHLNKINPEINLDSIPMTIPATRYIPWNIQNENEGRIAQVSSFGLQGSIVTIILQEYISSKKENCENKCEKANSQDKHVLTVSAKDKTAMIELYNKYVQILENMSENECVADLCYTTNIGRQHFENRIAAIGKTSNELLKDLQIQYEMLLEKDMLMNNISNSEDKKTIENILAKRKMNKYIVMTCGESQFETIPDLIYQNASYLYHTQPVFMEAIDTCDKLIIDISKYRVLLVSIILTIGESENSELITKCKNEINNNPYMNQFILLSLHYANYRLLESLGISQHVVIGHMYGELISAVLSGKVSLSHAFSLIQHISQWNKLENKASDEKIIEMLTNWTNEPENTENYTHNDVNKNMISKKIFYSCNEKRIYLKNEELSTNYWISFVMKLLSSEKEIVNMDDFEKECQKVLTKYEKETSFILNMSINGSVENSINECIKSINSTNNDLTLIPQFSLYKESNLNVNIYECIRNLFQEKIEINWENFHKRFVFNTRNRFNLEKISLPNYPFQRSRFWPIEN